jgi:hypothetical protein
VIAFKHLHARVQRTVWQNIIHGKSLFLLCPTPHFPLLYGNMYNDCQVSVPTHLSQPFQLMVLMVT